MMYKMVTSISFMSDTCKGTEKLSFFHNGHNVFRHIVYTVEVFQIKKQVFARMAKPFWFGVTSL